VEEEIKVGRILQEGTEEEKQAAKCKLVRSNLRFVLMMAKKNQHRNDLDLLDAIQAGNMGLMEAAERFDPTYNNRFITYATTGYVRLCINIFRIMGVRSVSPHI
jgi:RNA polymerase sigma factor (sigma-70 family)